MIQVPQPRVCYAGSDVVVQMTGAADMSAWTVVADLVGAVLLDTRACTVGNGPAGTGTVVTADYTDGTSYALAAGTYLVRFRRTDAGARDSNMGTVQMSVLTP